MTVSKKAAMQMEAEIISIRHAMGMIYTVGLIHSNSDSEYRAKFESKHAVKDFEYIVKELNGRSRIPQCDLHINNEGMYVLGLSNGIVLFAPRDRRKVIEVYKNGELVSSLDDAIGNKIVNPYTKRLVRSGIEFQDLVENTLKANEIVPRMGV